MDKKDNWKQKTLIIGGIIGILAGLVAAQILIQRAEAEDSRPSLTAGEGVKVGLGLLTLLKIISDLAARK